jgi:hypothetical protein
LDRPEKGVNKDCRVFRVQRVKTDHQVSSAQLEVQEHTEFRDQL